MAVAVAVDVLVEVDVDVLDEVAVAEALNVPEVVSEPDIDCVLVLVEEDVAVDVAVGVAVAVPVAEARATPVCTRTSQRYVVAVSDTDISDRLSPASANTALVSKAAFNPFATLTVATPPPSVSSRRMNRIPGFVGLARIRVSEDAPVVISQTCRSALGRMVPPLPGSTSFFGPR